MRNQLLFLARPRCHCLLDIELSITTSCLLPDLGFTPPLSADHWAQAVLPSDITIRHQSTKPTQTKSITHQKLRYPSTSSRQAFETLRQKSYKRSNTQGLVLWTESSILGRPYSTGPTGVVERGIQLLEEEGHSGTITMAEAEERSGTMAEAEERSGTMPEAEGITGSVGSHRMKDGEILYPAVDTYGPITIRGSELEPGKKKKWCTCGLSKKAPWCDGAHKKTGFKSLKWEVPEKPQSIYQICNCQYTKSPPFCDGTHTNLPEEVLERQKSCANKPNHEQCLKMCTGCGWKVDF